MPELAEVEIVRRGLSDAIKGQSVVSVRTDGNERFTDASRVQGKTVEEVRRRGKYILISFGSEELIIHLGMTGILRFTTEEAPSTRYRAVWKFSDGKELTLFDVRGFGRCVLVEKGQYENVKGLAALGPEPFDNFDRSVFAKAFMKEGANVKSRLLGQKHLAGVGNYVADESLWAAKIHPEKRSLTRAQGLRLADSVLQVFTEGLQRGGLSIKDYQHTDGSLGTMTSALKCYSRDGQPCLRCSTTLVKTSVAARGTTWCPKCQKK